MFENRKTEFDFTGLDRENTAVCCQSLDECSVLLEYLVAAWTWREESMRRWLNDHRKLKDYKPACFGLSGGWDYEPYYNDIGYSIVDFQDVYIPYRTPKEVCIAYGYDDMFGKACER